MTSPVPSPCVSVCRIDTASGVCEGCLRTLDEIAAWSAMPEEAKRVIWLRLGQRRLERRRRAAADGAGPAGPA